MKIAIFLYILMSFITFFHSSFQSAVFCDDSDLPACYDSLLKDDAKNGVTWPLYWREILRLNR